MTEEIKWQEARAAWAEFKSGKITNSDFWLIVRDIVSGKYFFAAEV